MTSEEARALTGLTAPQLGWLLAQDPECVKAFLESGTVPKQMFRDMSREHLLGLLEKHRATIEEGRWICARR